MMSDDRKHTGFKVSKKVLEDAKKASDHGELSEELRRTVHELAYGAEVTRREQVKEELEQLRDEKQDLVMGKQQTENKIRRKQREIERKEAELDKLQDTNAEYKGMLESIEADLNSGSRVWGEQPRIRSAANKANKTTAEVISDLRERNPEVPDKAFREAEDGESPRWKDKKEWSSV